MPQVVRKTSIIWGFIQEAVSEGSIRGASLRAAAQRASCTTPLVYRIFGSRRDLVRECVRWTFSSLLDKVAVAASAESASAVERLDAVATYVAERALGEQEVFESLVMLESRSDPALAAELRSIFTRLTDLLGAMLRQGIAAKQLRPDLDVSHYAWRLVDLGMLRSQLFLSGLDTLRGPDHLQRTYAALLAEMKLPEEAAPSAGQRARRTAPGGARRR